MKYAHLCILILCRLSLHDIYITHPLSCHIFIIHSLRQQKLKHQLRPRSTRIPLNIESIFEKDTASNCSVLRYFPHDGPYTCTLFVDCFDIGSMSNVFLFRSLSLHGSSIVALANVIIPSKLTTFKLVASCCIIASSLLMLEFSISQFRNFQNTTTWNCLLFCNPIFEISNS